jgi:ketosteroid isomerase-like protein
MSENSSVARYRQAFEAMSSGEMDGWADSVAEDVVWWEIGASEPVRGREALMKQMQFMGDFDVSVDLHDVAASDDHLIALLDVTAKKGDETLNYRTAEIHHLNQAGQVSERWAFSDDTAAIIDFFG